MRKEAYFELTRQARLPMLPLSLNCLAMDRARTRVMRHATAALAALAVAASARAAAPDDVRIAVGNAGPQLVVEAHRARLGQVLDQLKTRLGITIAYGDGLDLARIVDGRGKGSIVELLRWLTPDISFVLFYDAPRSGAIEPPRLKRIVFLDSNGSGSVKGASRAASADAEFYVAPVSRSATPRLAPAGSGQAGAPPRGGAEVNTFAKQLRSANARATLWTPARAPIETPNPFDTSATAAQPPDGAQQNASAPPPAQPISVEEMLRRAQALAIGQLQMLMNAYKAACKGKGSGGTC